MPDLPLGDDDHDAPRWHCLRAQPRREHLAAGHLAALPGVQAYCPRVRLRRPTRTGAKWFTEALFPSYLFARFRHTEQRRHIQSVHGVTRILQFGPDPHPLPDSLIADLRLHFPEDTPRILSTDPRPGDTVILVIPPLVGIHTLVTRILPAHQRIEVLLDIMGRLTPVTLPSTSALLRSTP